MKLIKAYVRQFLVGELIESLEEIGAPRLIAIDIRALGDEIAPERLNISMELENTYTVMVKLELICPDEMVNKYIETIISKARTGRKGDGIIVISPIEETINIRTGRKGEIHT